MLVFLTVIYVCILLCVSITNIVGPESWWLGSLNLYLPQWPWGVPCAVFFPWYLITAWRWTWVPIVLFLWVAGPIMGCTLHIPGTVRTTRETSPTELRLRVMTYNIKWGSRDAAAVAKNIAAEKADVVLMQDSGSVLQYVLRPLYKNWKTTVLGQYTVLSRYDISDVEERWLTPDRTHHCLRFQIHVGRQTVTFYDVHLITPRWALGAIEENGADGVTDLQKNVNTRLMQAAMTAAGVKQEKQPVVLTGDLNAPVQSRVCKEFFDAGLRDAFSEAGNGYGFTYGQSTPIHQPYVRIDHILVSPEWQVLGCHEGNARGSDHSPVIADLVLSTAP